MSEYLTTQFYKELLQLPAFSNDSQKRELKQSFFNSNLINNTLYKYISFNDNQALNEEKLTCLQNNELWFSAHYVLRNNDSTEFQINANIARVSNATGASIPEIVYKLKVCREISDLCCFSNRLHEYMWANYANDHSGICCVFEVLDPLEFWPVLYCDKKQIDFTKEIISMIKDSDINFYALKMLFLPFVLKDKKRYGVEQEIRLMSSDSFDDENDVLGGRVEPGKKEKLGYTGRAYTYEYCHLALKKIIIGRNTPKRYIEELQKINIPIEFET